MEHLNKNFFFRVGQICAENLLLAKNNVEKYYCKSREKASQYKRLRHFRVSWWEAGKYFPNLYFYGAFSGYGFALWDNQALHGPWGSLFSGELGYPLDVGMMPDEAGGEPSL
jgi:hypothetical protein